MEALAERFIEERAQRGVQGPGRRVPEDLRRLAVRFATRWIAQGGTTQSGARRLGVHQQTLERWMDEHDGVQESRAEFREILVRDEVPPRTPSTAAATTLALVTPAGFRIEGLTFAEASTLLDQLA